MQLVSIADVTINGCSVQTVNARDLYQFLGVSKDFSGWLKMQLERARLVDGRDFVVANSLTQKGEQDFEPKHGGANRKDYHLTLEAAKHIGMMSGTDKGFEVRDYFIDCERRAAAYRVAIPQTLPEALRLAATAIELKLVAEAKVGALEATVAEQAPKVEAFEHLTDASGALTITAASKVIGLRPSVLFEWLASNGWIYKGEKSRAWLAYATRVDQGLLDHRLVNIPDADGNARIKPSVQVLAKGLALMTQHLIRDGRVVAVTA